MIDFDPFHPICFQCGSVHVGSGCRKCYQRAYRAANLKRLSEYRSEYYYANQAQAINKSKAYHERNVEARREYHKAYHIANRDARLARSRLHYWENREAYLARNRDWRVTNRDSNAARKRAYQKAHPEVKQAAEARRRTRVRTNMTSEDRATSVAWRKFLKYCPCFYCGEFAEVTHIDHLTPLSRGGSDVWFNLQQSCQKCNLSKGTKTADEFQAAKSEAHNMPRVGQQGV